MQTADPLLPHSTQPRDCLRQYVRCGDRIRNAFASGERGRQIGFHRNRLQVRPVQVKLNRAVTAAEFYREANSSSPCPTSNASIPGICMPMHTSLAVRALLPFSLELPSGLVVATVMKKLARVCERTVQVVPDLCLVAQEPTNHTSKPAVARLLVILAHVGLVIEPLRHTYITGPLPRPWPAHDTSQRSRR